MAARENCSLAFPAPRQSRGTGWGPLYPALSLLIQTSFFLRAQPEPPSSPAALWYRGRAAGQEAEHLLHPDVTFAPQLLQGSPARPARHP